MMRRIFVYFMVALCEVGYSRKMYDGVPDTEKSEGDSERYDVNLNEFNRFEQINLWIKEQEEYCRRYDGLTCQLRTLTLTYHMKEVMLFTITASSDPGVPVMYLDSGTHAREWLGPATNLKVINKLITGYNSDDDVTRLMETREFHFVMVVNPDGYVTTWDKDRHHTKNLSPNADTECNGTDLNSNFNYRWDEGGVSQDPCSSTYRGSSAGSELETQAIMSHLVTVGPRTRLVLSLHSYGMAITYPWGNTVEAGNDAAPCQVAQDQDDLHAVAEAASQAMHSSGGLDWVYGSSCSLQGPNTGTTIDYAKGMVGIKYAFSVKLRGSDYVIDPSYIEPSFQELWAGVVAMDTVITERSLLTTGEYMSPTVQSGTTADATMSAAPESPSSTPKTTLPPTTTTSPTLSGSVCRSNVMFTFVLMCVGILLV